LHFDVASYIAGIEDAPLKGRSDIQQAAARMDRPFFPAFFKKKINKMESLTTNASQGGKAQQTRYTDGHFHQPVAQITPIREKGMVSMTMIGSVEGTYFIGCLLHNTFYTSCHCRKDKDRFDLFLRTLPIAVDLIIFLNPTYLLACQARSQ
jgi:hypothetical protein